MGNFSQHMRASTLTGVVYGGAVYTAGVPLPTSLLAAGACSMAGMLPDIDSDTSQSFRECIYLAAGLAAVLTTMRLQESIVDGDTVALCGAGVFLFVRYGVGRLVQKWTSHRGMMHSLPMAIICGEIAFLCSAGPLEMRLVKAFGLVLGFLSHLVLDEIYSIDLRGMHIKKSFGTALKWSNPKDKRTTTFVYSALLLLGFLCVSEPQIREQFPQIDETLQQVATISQEENLGAIEKFVTEKFTVEKLSAIEIPQKVALQALPAAPILTNAPPPNYVASYFVDHAQNLQNVAPKIIVPEIVPEVVEAIEPISPATSSTSVPSSTPFPTRPRAPADLRW